MANMVIDEYKKIEEYISTKSDSLSEIIKRDNDWEYLMIVKNISHSDLTNSGKRNGMGEGLDRNYLYYMTTTEMEEIEDTRHKPFESAKQSNIFVPSDFYKFLEMPELHRRIGPQTEEHEHPVVNKYADVYLVNDTLKYFNIEYTQKVFDKLDKHPSWDIEKLKYTLEGDFTPIQLTHAIHGIGTAEDETFHKLRKSIFKGDTLIVLLRKKETKREVYILLEKNPKFYTIIGEGNESWEKFLEKNNKLEMFELLKKASLSEGEKEKTRKNQNKWRNLLADEMMTYTVNENEIFCPLTYITANFQSVGTLYRASHIKEFSECNVDEAFDINNGIIMVANADALFDKHLITIDDDGTIIFSFLFDKDFKLKTELRLTEKVFKAILNAERLKYIKFHREEFYKKEEKRKKVSVLAEDSSEDELL